ncbi:NAD-dependent succinate-semialdehyde dehydrogenase [Streptomyces phaeochromogenes]|uniref:NAD-dependent succinate-semialdehyde dehydrogenase n=1 Tax=Streptomyces phaeochromogenes TaxID=1923 RepID=UPI0022569148|nr:NAD-dependent succinate-semialdehyde dehydrogenase [Streptomyces phaeochromogenes]MCX5603808.1 NAD-dependent succinate-semialdehyde dehydrogenase [Streptomyces phaeochromogenes]
MTEHETTPETKHESQYKIVDPATNTLVRRYPTSDDAAVDRAVSAAADEFAEWRRRPVKERADLVLAVSREFEARREELAAIITREMGKTTREALGEVDLSAAIFAYYAEHGPDFAADQRLDIRGGGDVVVRSEPLGALLGVMPWNYPYYQVARFVAPNLVLGNTVVLKHAPSCPESAQAIEDMMRAAGLPAGAYVNVYATNEQVARVITDPRVQGVSLTGSERAGRAVGEIAGRHLKKYVLELGGSDPFVVLPDADLEAAVGAAVEGRMGNAGQACTASKRFIVVDSVYDRFLEAFTDAVRALTVGDPTDDGVSFGPLSSEEAARTVIAQVDDAVERGATAVTGGRRPAREGAFVEPTVLTGVTPGMRAYREEIFGPVAVVHRVPDTAAAVHLANDTPYGLGSVVFGRDIAAAKAVADALDVGMVSINGPSGTQEDLPFGGVKLSGVGRELGAYGMAEFVNRKVIRVRGEAGGADQVG